MELTSDFITIQGTMRNLEKKIGSFTRIKYRGGNEANIISVIMELGKILVDKNYMTRKRVVNPLFEKELNNIVLFLVLNSEFKNSLDIKEYSHLVGIMPMFSKCLLVSAIVELNLVEHYCRSVRILPLEFSQELLCEFIPCLKKKASGVALELIYEIIKTVIEKLSCVDLGTYKVRESVDHINEICSELLIQLTGISSENLVGIKKNDIHLTMGLTLHRFFNLLHLCPTSSEALKIITNKLIVAASTIVKAVTINVYCDWADVDYGDQSLQEVVSNEAFFIIEKYSKYKSADELIQMLGTIARKPKSIEESIHEASIDTVIAKVNANEEHQKRWFTALLNTKVFNNPDSIKCLSKWSHLCTTEDVERLLRLAMEFKTSSVCCLVIKCAGNLKNEDLLLVIVRFFRSEALKNHLQYEDIRPHLTPILNTIGNAESINTPQRDELMKKIMLLLLQDPITVINNFCFECIKNKKYNEWLRPVFKNLKDVLLIDMFSGNALEGAFDRGLSDEEIEGYAVLTKTLVETDSCNYVYVFKNIYNPYLRMYLDEGNDVGVKSVLLIIQYLNMETLPGVISKEFVTLSMNVLQKYRCTFVNFTMLHMEICMILTNMLRSFNIYEESIETTNAIDKYYLSSTYKSFLEMVYPNFNIENYGDAVSKLIKILSRCVPKEWLLITNDLVVSLEAENAIEMLTDCVILICQVAATQNNVSTWDALKFYLQNYGMCIKNLQDRRENLTFEVTCIENILRLIKVIPSNMRYNEAVNLLPLLTTSALKAKKSDKSFLLLLVDIDSDVAKIIAKKIME